MTIEAVALVRDLIARYASENAMGSPFGKLDALEVDTLEVVEALLEGFGAENYRVPLACMEALQRTTVAQAQIVETLRQHLGGNPKFRDGIYETFKALLPHSTVAVPDVIRQLGSTETLDLWEAREALDFLLACTQPVDELVPFFCDVLTHDMAREEEALHGTSEMLAGMCSLIAQLAPKSGRCHVILRKAASQGQRDICLAATRALIQLGQDPTTPLLQAFQQPQINPAASSITPEDLLGLLLPFPARYSEILLTILGSETPPFFYGTRLLFEKMARAAQFSPEEWSTLEQYLEEQHTGAIYLLGFTGEKAQPFVPRLLAWLEPSSPEIAEASAFALGSLGDASDAVVSALQRTLANIEKIEEDDDEQAEISGVFLDALVRLGRSDLTPFDLVDVAKMCRSASQLEVHVAGNENDLASVFGDEAAAKVFVARDALYFLYRRVLRPTKDDWETDEEEFGLASLRSDGDLQLEALPVHCHNRKTAAAHSHRQFQLLAFEDPRLTCRIYLPAVWHKGGKSWGAESYRVCFDLDSGQWSGFGREGEEALLASAPWSETDIPLETRAGDTDDYIDRGELLFIQRKQGQWLCLEDEFDEDPLYRLINVERMLRTTYFPEESGNIEFEPMGAMSSEEGLWLLVRAVGEFGKSTDFVICVEVQE